MTDLTSRRCGDLAEMFVASRLLADPALEVFTTASDDGGGHDLAVRSLRTGRWYGVQVKATTRATHPFVYLRAFRESSDFIVAAVVLDEDRHPERVYLVRGTDWGDDSSGCLGRNDAGGDAGPYVEVRTGAAKYRESLEHYRLDVVVPTL